MMALGFCIREFVSLTCGSQYAVSKQMPYLPSVFVTPAAADNCSILSILYFIYSFIFSNRFILVSVVVDLKTYPGNNLSVITPIGRFGHEGGNWRKYITPQRHRENMQHRHA